MYLANPCASSDVITAMVSGQIGLIDAPDNTGRAGVIEAHAGGAVWCADNGCFADGWEEGKWWRFLTGNAYRADTCLFAVAPDVVGDAWRTHIKSLPWLPKIRALGYPVAYVAQDGIDKHPMMPWDDFDVLFIGGTTEFKLGPVAREYAAEAKRRGKHVHMGRVNSRRRLEYARAIGCDSADGTFLTFGPKTNLPRLLAWLHEGLFDYEMSGEQP